MFRGGIPGSIRPLLVLALAACTGSHGGASSSVDAPRGTALRAAAPTLTYRAIMANDLSSMDVRVCPGERSPGTLAPIGRLREARLTYAEGPAGEALRIAGDRIDLSAVPAGACVRYGVSFDLAGSFLGGRRSGGAVLLSQTSWLLRPDPLVPGTSGTLVMDQEGPIRAFLPWPERNGIFELDHSTFTLAAYTAFGRFDVDGFEVPGARVRVAVLGDVSMEPAELRRWLFEAASAVARLDGTFPLPEVAVSVLPASPGSLDDPVAFGLVRRGGGASVMLLLRDGADPEATVRDWVAAHELAHLATPLLTRSGAWLSEGIATYYQEVLRARQGIITPLEAWRNLDAGFERGRRDGGTGLPLREESARMRHTHAYRHVYWSGTAFALELDLMLRSRTGGAKSLDLALSRLREEGAAAVRPWPPEKLLRRMDEVLETDACTSLSRLYAQRVGFPDVAPLFRAVGLERGADGLLRDGADSDKAALRSAIMRGAPEAMAGRSPPPM